MSQFIKCNVVMLPIQSKAVRLVQLVIGPGNNLFPSRQSNDIGTLTAYELYITSDEEINKDDWCVLDLGENTRIIRVKSLNSGHSIFTVDIVDGYAQLSSLRKIIATTDTSLRRMGDDGIVDIALGLEISYIPESFIKYFIEEYNKGNVITKAMVEYDEMLQVRHGVKWYDLPNQTQGNDRDGIYKKVLRLKLNSDNTINIKPIKDSWDLNEIKVFAVKCFNAGRQYQIDSIDIFNDKWIEENL